MILFKNIETNRLVLKNIGIDEMRINEISACIYIDNQRSIRLVENLGFVLSDSIYQLFRSQEYLHNIYSFYVTQ